MKELASPINRTVTSPATLQRLGRLDRQPSSGGGYLNAAALLRMLRRRVGLIALTVCLGLLAALIIVAGTPPVYSSTATVMVEPDENAAAGALPSAVTNPALDVAIETKVELLRSRNLARDVAKSLGLQDDPEFAPEADASPGLVDRFMAWIVPRPPVASLDGSGIERELKKARSEEIVDRLIERLDIARVARSSLVSITASSSDPQKAALIANRTGQIYIKTQAKGAHQSREEAINGLAKRVSDARAVLEGADRQVADFRQSSRLLTSRPEEMAAVGVSQLTGILAQAQADRAADARRSAVSMAGGGTSATSALLTDLRQQESILERRRGELSSFYGPGYPEIAKVQAELSALRGRMDVEDIRLRADLNNQASASQARAAVVGANLAALRSTTLASGTPATELRALERKAEAANALYLSLLGMLNSKVSSRPDADADISIVSRAPVPDVPSAPLPKQAFTVAALGSLGLGILLALVIEMIDTKVRTAEQVERLLGLPTLAMVPDTLLDAGSDETGVEIIARRPQSRFAEAMRNLLIELESRTVGGSHVVVVTSPLEGEGKNTISSGLAAAAGRLQRRVVLVDFDLRRPDSLPHESSTPHVGLVPYLSGAVGVDELGVAEQQAPFARIGVGESALDPGALLISPRLPSLVAHLREHYDLIILNAPPILPVRDAKTLADFADSTLLVLKWGKTDPEAARIALRVFGRTVTGAVINMVDFKAHAGRRYGDAIHHVAYSKLYLDQSGAPRGLAALRYRLRRMGQRFASALHLA